MPFGQVPAEHPLAALNLLGGRVLIVLLLLALFLQLVLFSRRQAGFALFALAALLHQLVCSMALLVLRGRLLV